MTATRCDRCRQLCADWLLVEPPEETGLGLICFGCDTDMTLAMLGEEPLTSADAESLRKEFRL